MYAPGDVPVGRLRPHAELDTDGLGGFVAAEAGTPVSAAVIDAHAGVPGSGYGGAGTMVIDAHAGVPGSGCGGAGTMVMVRRSDFR